MTRGAGAAIWSLLWLTMCTPPRSSPVVVEATGPSSIEGARGGIVLWLARNQIKDVKLQRLLVPDSMNPDLIVKLLHIGATNCGESSCGPFVAHALARKLRTRDFFEHIAVVSGVPRQQIHVFLDVPPCWRYELVGRQDGSVSGTFVALCKLLVLPSECFRRAESVPAQPLARLMNIYSISLKTLFKGDEVVLLERGERSLDFHIAIDRARARVVPDSWESLEVLTLFTENATSVCVQLVIDGRYAPSGFRRPDEADFLDLQPEYDRQLRALGTEILDALRARMG